MFSSALGDLPEIAECLGCGFPCVFFLPAPQIFCEVLSIKVTVSCNAGVVFRCPPLRVAGTAEEALVCDGAWSSRSGEGHQRGLTPCAHSIKNQNPP